MSKKKFSRSREIRYTTDKSKFDNIYDEDLLKKFSSPEQLKEDKSVPKEYSKFKKTASLTKNLNKNRVTTDRPSKRYDLGGNKNSYKEGKLKPTTKYDKFFKNKYDFKSDNSVTRSEYKKRETVKFVKPTEKNLNDLDKVGKMKVKHSYNNLSKKYQNKLKKELYRNKTGKSGVYRKNKKKKVFKANKQF